MSIFSLFCYEYIYVSIYPSYLCFLYSLIPLSNNIKCIDVIYITGYQREKQIPLNDF